MSGQKAMPTHRIAQYKASPDPGPGPGHVLWRTKDLHSHRSANFMLAHVLM